MGIEGKLRVSSDEKDNRRGCSGELEFGGDEGYWDRCSGVVWNVRAAADAMGSAALGREVGRDVLVGVCRGVG